MNTAKAQAALIAQSRLAAFLRSDRRLNFRPLLPPRVSVLVLCCNRAEVTLACLSSLLMTAGRSRIELVVVDNGSQDETAALLDRLDGAVVLRNATNLGYPIGVNQAARVARGEYLLLLNNDTELFPGSIETGIAYLDNHPTVGMVGGRVILLDGTLQEAGCLLSSDGWAHQLGRGRHADDPTIDFEREVDYCSAVFLLVRQSLFAMVGGLDEHYSPGYFEDPDLAIRFHQLGFTTVFLPGICTLHYENATSAGLYDLQSLVARNHQQFLETHADWLVDQPTVAAENYYRLRRADETAIPLLLLGQADRVDWLRQVAAAATQLDGLPTVVVITADRGQHNRIRRELPSTLEFVPLATAAAFGRFLDERRGSFDLALCDPTLDPELLLLIEEVGIPVGLTGHSAGSIV